MGTDNSSAATHELEAMPGRPRGFNSEHLERCTQLVRRHRQPDPEVPAGLYANPCPSWSIDLKAKPTGRNQRSAGQAWQGRCGNAHEERSRLAGRNVLLPACSATSVTLPKSVADHAIGDECRTCRQPGRRAGTRRDGRTGRNKGGRKVERKGLGNPALEAQDLNACRTVLGSVGRLDLVLHAAKSVPPVRSCALVIQRKHADSAGLLPFRPSESLRGSPSVTKPARAQEPHKIGRATKTLDAGFRSNIRIRWEARWLLVKEEADCQEYLKA